MLSKLKRLSAAILSMTMAMIFAAAAFSPTVSRAEVEYAPAYQNSDTGYVVYICDEAWLLTYDEVTQLIQEVAPITEYASVLFYTTNEDPYGGVEKLAQIETWDYFGDENGVAFFIDMDCRQICVWGRGDMKKKFERGLGKGIGDTITDNVYRYASKGDYYTCASKAFEQIYSSLKGEKVATPMKIISNALIAIVAGFLITFGMVASKTAKKKPEVKTAASIVVGTVAVAGLTSALINTKRVYSPRSSGGGGSHGGGGHGGGGHSGGGGGSHGF